MLLVAVLMRLVGVMKLLVAVLVSLVAFMNLYWQIDASVHSFKCSSSRPDGSSTKGRITKVERSKCKIFYFNFTLCWVRLGKENFWAGHCGLLNVE